MKKTNVSGVLFSDNLVTVVQEMTDSIKVKMTGRRKSERESTREGVNKE